MISIAVQINGVTQTQANLKKKINPAKIKEMLIRLGFMIEADAKRYCPVDTGRLRASISTNWDGSGKSHASISSPVGETKPSDGATMPQKAGGEVAVVRIGSNVEYASYLEYGTSRSAAQPYLLPAYLNNINKIKTMLEKSI